MHPLVRSAVLDDFLHVSRCIMTLLIKFIHGVDESLVVQKIILMSFTYRNPHEQSYGVAQEEVTRLQREGREIEARLSWIRHRLEQLQKYLDAVRPLIEEDPGSEAVQAGLTQICRELLGKNPRWLSAGEIRALLFAGGIDLKPYANPMAVLHSVLGRIAHKQKSSDGTVYYAAPGVPPFDPDQFPPKRTEAAIALKD
jgi:hypothetical protein